LLNLRLPPLASASEKLAVGQKGKGVASLGRTTKWKGGKIS